VGDTVTPEQLVAASPLLFHMAQQGSWASIRRVGLLSTTALLDFFEIAGDEREKIESQHRPESVAISHPRHGVAVIRDQKPMSDAGLRRCLQDGTSPEDWYRLLNSRVFFWATRERLETLMAARAYRYQRHAILTVDTAELLKRHSDRVQVTTMNTGCTVPRPFPRGRNTFVPLCEFDYEVSRRARGRARAIAEVAVRYGVPDLAEFVRRVEHRGGGVPSELLFER
jgi:uncharacterized protein DUF7002